MTGFLKRYAFHDTKIKGESASADELAAKGFSQKLAKTIEDGRHSSEFGMQMKMACFGKNAK